MEYAISSLDRFQGTNESSNVHDTNHPDEDRGTTVLGACISLTIGSIIAVVLRLWVIFIRGRKLGWDDATIIPALVVAVAGLIIIIILIANGGGRHASFLKPSANILNIQLAFARQLIYLWSITLMKCSIALFLLRFAPHRRYRQFLRFLVIFFYITSLCATLAILLQCNPVRSVWDPSVEGNCYPTSTLTGIWYAVNGTSIVTDLILSFLPMPMLWNVQIHPRVKAVLLFIMSLGLFAAASCGIKLYYISEARGPEGGDTVFDATYIHIWSCAECNLGIIAACIPTLKPMFKAYFYHGVNLLRSRSGRQELRDRLHRERMFGQSGGMASVESVSTTRPRCTHSYRSSLGIGRSLVSHTYRTTVIEAEDEHDTMFHPPSSRSSKPSHPSPSRSRPYHPSSTHRSFSPPMRRRDGDNILDEDEVSLSDVRILYADASRSIELPLHVPVPVPLLPVVAVPATMVSMGVGPVGMDLEFDDEDLVATASLRDISRLRSEEGRWPRTHSRSRSARTESPRSSPSNGATPKSRSPRREGSGASRNGSSLRPSESVSKTASKESMSTLNTLRAGRERAERRRRGSRLSQEVVEEEGGEDFVGRTPRGSPGPGE